MKTIYNVYVPIEIQEQADRMKQICIDYKLPYWDDEDAFILTLDYKYFSYFEVVFWVCPEYVVNNKTQVTESEFLELVKINFAN